MPNIHWDDLNEAINRLRALGRYEEPDEKSIYGYYQDQVDGDSGFPIIGLDSPINHGVFLGRELREAVKVDESYGRLIQIYTSFLANNGKIIRLSDLNIDSILWAVKQQVTEIFPYKPEIAVSMANKLDASSGLDPVVLLDHYIELGGGANHHQALLVAYLLERLVAGNYIHGRVSLDSNTVSSQGSHAWVRYTDWRGEVYIVDPTYRFVSLLTQVKDTVNEPWFYYRPTDPN